MPCKDPGRCVTCHEDQSSMDASHALECVRCHGGNPETDDQDKAHTGLIKDPGDLRFVEKTCGRCHPEQAGRVKRSPMALAPRMISHTRFAFGSQPRPDPIHAVIDFERLTQVPSPSRSGNLGDDLLRRSCLRCHLYTCRLHAVGRTPRPRVLRMSRGLSQQLRREAKASRAGAERGHDRVSQVPQFQSRRG